MIYPPPSCALVFWYLLNGRGLASVYRKCAEHDCCMQTIEARMQFSDKEATYRRQGLAQLPVKQAWATGPSNTQKHSQTDRHRVKETHMGSREKGRQGKERRRERQRQREADRKTNIKTQRHTPWGAVRKGKRRSGAKLKAKQLLTIFSNMFKFVVKLYWDVYVTL